MSHTARRLAKLKELGIKPLPKAKTQQEIDDLTMKEKMKIKAYRNTVKNNIIEQEQYNIEDYDNFKRRNK